MDYSPFVTTGSNLVSSGLGLVGTYLNYKYNSALMDKQNQYNLDMWKMQAEYNSPKNQMRRFEEAGLNPALVYSQGNPGNMQQAPQMSVPEAPNYSKDLRDLTKAFNIEGLRTAIANRKTAEAEARSATAAAEDRESDNEALRRLYWNYSFDPKTGQFVFDGGVADRNGHTFTAKPLYPTAKMMGEAKLMKILSDNYRTNSLLVPRGRLIGSQIGVNTKRQELFAPQIRYWNFNTEPWRMKTNFWIGNATKGVQAVTPFITPFINP